jgi:hypothetical protein
MPNYQEGKIYKLVGNGKVYIGSTVSTLCRRKQQHITDFKSNHPITSREVVSDSNHYIELIEYFPCNTKEELLKRERYYIDQIECVNKQKPCRTQREYYEDNTVHIKEQRKAYRDANKASKKQIDKAYREQNRDEILQKKLIYRESRRVELCEKQKLYYEANKEAIQAKKTLNRQIKRLESVNTL